MWAVEKAFRALACRTDIDVGVSRKEKRIACAFQKKTRISMISHLFSPDHLDGLTLFLSSFIHVHSVSVLQSDLQGES